MTEPIKHYENLSLEDIPGEIWKPVVGYEKLYSVSNFGRVKANPVFQTGTKGTVYVKYPLRIRTQTNIGGYRRVMLTVKGKKKFVGVHRLVMQAFVPNPENKPEVNHINAVKWDNRLENLEWCTGWENFDHEVFNLRRKRYKSHKPTPIPKPGKYYVYLPDGSLFGTFHTMKAAGQSVGMSLSVVCRAIRTATDRFGITFSIGPLENPPVHKKVEFRKPKMPVYAKKPPHENQTIQKRKPLYVYNCHGDLMFWFESIYFASQFLNIKRKRIDKVLKGAQKSTQGMRFRTERIDRLEPYSPV